MNHLLFSLPKIIGHRGACGYAPENTLASLHKAKSLGVQWVEFDVMLTQDDIPIVFHDLSLERTTNGKGNVAETFYKDIADLDAGSWFGVEFKAEKIPAFELYLKEAAKLRLGINIEVKPNGGNETIIAAKVLEAVRQHWPKEALPPLFSSFSEPILSEIRSLDKDCYLGLLARFWKPEYKALCESLNCISTQIRHNNLKADIIKEIKSVVQFVLAYTVNDAIEVNRLFGMGVDGVFSDVPDRVSGF